MWDYLDIWNHQQENFFNMYTYKLEVLRESMDNFLVTHV